MKILKNAGTFEILTKPENVIEQIAKAARTCYQSEEFATEEKNIKLVENLLKRGHHAMIEFSDMAVRFNNVCRGFTHEMVRHRLVSYAQESTRYVDESDFKVVVPPHKDENEFFRINTPDYKGAINLKNWFEMNETMYKALRKAGWKPEDARQVLPIAIKSQIVVKANIREWRHIFHMRCDRFAHWEIRGVMLQLLNECKKVIPLIFDDFKFYSPNFKDELADNFEKLTHELIVKDKIFARNY